MSRLLLVRGARQLLTLHGPAGPRRGADLRNLGIIQDGSVLIVDGLIRDVGPTRRLENLALARNALEISAAGKVIMPGFVDSHTHLVSGPARLMDFEMRLAGATREEIQQAGGGPRAIWRAIQDVSVRTLEGQAWRVLQECIRQGTTTLEAKSGYGINEAGQLKILRVQAALNRRLDNLVSTFMASRLMLPEFHQTQDEHLEWLCARMLPLVRRRKFAEFAEITCGEGQFTPEQGGRFLSQAKMEGFKVKVHAGEGRQRESAKMALELGAVSADHALFLDGEAIMALAGSRTIATVLPGPSFYQGAQRYAAVRDFIDRGVAVALATDYNPETCPTDNMQMIVALACREMGMTPAEAIGAATINGAYALGRGDRIGSLEFGKQADLIMLSVPDYREIPYHFGVNLVEMTMKRGNVIYRASEVKCPPA